SATTHSGESAAPELAGFIDSHRQNERRKDLSRKFLILLAALALAMFGMAACGSDDDDADTGGEAATTTETPAEEPAGDGEEAGGGEGGTVEFTADPKGGLTYEEKSVETK